MGPATALTTSVRRSFDFSGRATRSEFWWTWCILYVVSQMIQFWRSLPTVQQGASWCTTALLCALALPVMAVGTRRLVDAGVWRWAFVAVFIYGVVAQVVYAIPLPHETSAADVMVQFEDQTLPISDLGYFPVLHWIRGAMPWVGYPAAIICLLLTLLPSRGHGDGTASSADRMAS